jgi:hypothetical protein
MIQRYFATNVIRFIIVYGQMKKNQAFLVDLKYILNFRAERGEIIKEAL